MAGRARRIQDFYNREETSEKYYTKVLYLATNGDIVGLQQELHLDPSKPVDMNKVNAATANMARLADIKEALGTSAQLVPAIDQNPGIPADVKAPAD